MLLRRKTRFQNDSLLNDEFCVLTISLKKFANVLLAEKLEIIFIETLESLFLLTAVFCSQLIVTDYDKQDIPTKSKFTFAQSRDSDFCVATSLVQTPNIRWSVDTHRA